MPQAGRCLAVGLGSADARLVGPFALFAPFRGHPIPPCIMLEMLIKEADQLIDPGVVNAPHVAALPDEGWVP